MDHDGHFSRGFQTFGGAAVSFIRGLLGSDECTCSACTGLPVVAFGSDFKKLDAHVITPEEYEEMPEWTDEMIAIAGVHEAGKLIRRGTNPKDLLGAKKLDLSLVPAIGIAHEAAAFVDGALKYGPYNWRDNAVQARVYIAAIRRHLDLWESGQEHTDDTGVHNLGAVRACANILLDAQMTGNLVDNRPKSPEFTAAMDKLNAWALARGASSR